MEHDTGRNTDLQEMVASYDNYEIKSAQAQCYIESLTPDLNASKTTKVDVGKYFGTAVLVVEVAGFRNWATKRVNFELSVEQNLLQALASMSYNQESIMGMIVFPEGLKLSQIVREQGEYTCNVKETGLVEWNSVDFFRVLQFIGKSLS